MDEIMVIQGRELRAPDIDQIRSVLTEHPDWHRTRISKEICQRWDWRNAKGRLKDMAARMLLLKLERAGLIKLPARRNPSSNGFRNRNMPNIPHVTDPVSCALRELVPLRVSVVGPGSADLRLFNCLLNRYHYLGHRNTVGENIRYLVRDRNNRPVACVLFGSAAWKCADRDAFIGWDRARRERKLQMMSNNTRFLIPPWVNVPHLASHVLGLIVRRIRSDWQVKYAHPLAALETFVDRERFRGTCYKAANFLMVGQTQGRTRSDRYSRIHVSIKDVYFYPLIKNFREELCGDYT
jgi:hypothetical protein